MVERQPLLWVVLYNVKDLQQRCSCTHMCFFFFPAYGLVHVLN